MRALLQTVAWEAVSTTDDRDDATYAAPVSVPARKLQRVRDMIAKDGEVTTATNQITLPFTPTVNVGDLLDGREVIAVNSMVDYRGILVGQQALTR